MTFSSLRILLLPLLALLVFAGCDSSSSSGTIPGANTMADGSTPDARYRVTFNATWGETAPPQFPSGPHFSPLVGAIHNSSKVFWASGATASDGIESMAETGATATFANEIRAAITANTAGAILSRGGVINAPATVSFEFEISETYPLVTLVTMIAPSPDWFAGVRDLALFENGAWLATKTVNLFAYDAGTDSGNDFTSANDDTQPPNNIALLTSHDFDGNKIGTFTFTRLTN